MYIVFNFCGSITSVSAVAVVVLLGNLLKQLNIVRNKEGSAYFKQSLLSVLADLCGSLLEKKKVREENGQERRFIFYPHAAVHCNSTRLLLMTNRKMERYTAEAIKIRLLCVSLTTF